MSPTRQLLNMPPDSRGFYDLADQIIISPDSTDSQKLTALRLIDIALGGTGNNITMADVANYIRDTNE